jgi:hypothetical protein
VGKYESNGPMAGCEIVQIFFHNTKQNKYALLLFTALGVNNSMVMGAFVTEGIQHDYSHAQTVYISPDGCRNMPFAAIACGCP